MKKLLDGVGGLLVFLGGVGVLHELTGWFDKMAPTRLLTENVRFLDDQAVFANLVVAVVGFAMCMIADRLG
ncbi:hypothetical protein [Streptomyces sp. NPDC005953]|uniref:hypothetical protein n=1 Tax=unclassified Streptomyces TaxID=2593676 RepID=UPI00340077E8